MEITCTKKIRQFYAKAHDLHWSDYNGFQQDTTSKTVIKALDSMTKAFHTSYTDNSQNKAPKCGSF